MKVRLLKDWSFHKSGDIVDVFDPTARSWIASQIAEEFIDKRSLEPVEQAVARPSGEVERAVRRPAGKK